MRKLTLLKNAVILTVTSFILRTFGMVVRLYVSNKIGAEGMGLYQLIISIYVLASTFVTAGVRTTIIRLVTDAIARRESNGNIRKIMIKATIISLIVSVFAIFLFYFLAEPISIYFLKDERCILSIKILVLVLPFLAVESCCKGYFLAKRRVIFNSLAQLFEQFVRIVFLFIFLEVWGKESLESVCMLIILSDMISEAASCMFVYLKYRKETKNFNPKGHNGFKLSEFFDISFPVALDKYITSILKTIENILIPNMLTIYTMSRELSLSQFGYLKGMALPLIFFPASFLTAISTLLIPEASEAKVLKQTGKITKLVERIIQFTLGAGIIIAMIFFVYSKEIGNVFYKTDEIAFYIKWLAPIIPFMYLESAISGMMQGLNQQRKALKYNVIDSVLRISLILLVLPKYGISGFLLIMYISNITTSMLNLIRLLKVSKTKFNFNFWLLKPVLASFASIVFEEIVFKYITVANVILNIVLRISAIAFSYILLLFLFGIIEKEHIEKVLYRRKAKYV